MLYKNYGEKLQNRVPRVQVLLPLPNQADLNIVILDMCLIMSVHLHSFPKR